MCPPLFVPVYVPPEKPRIRRLDFYWVCHGNGVAVGSGFSPELAYMDWYEKNASYFQGRMAGVKK